MDFLFTTNSFILLLFKCCCHVYNLMLLKCQSLHALKFAFVSKLEAMHHLALGNMKNLKVKNNFSFFVLKPVTHGSTFVDQQMLQLLFNKF